MSALSDSLAQSQDNNELEMLQKTGVGLVEMMVSGDIRNMWRDVRHVGYVDTAAHCLYSYTHCSDGE